MSRAIEKNDGVVVEVRFAPNVPPTLHEGKVVKVGKNGAQIRFDDAALRWVPFSKITVTERARPDGGARVRESGTQVPIRVKLSDVAPPPPPTPPPPPAPPFDPRLVASPPDPRPSDAAAAIAAWRSMGAELVDDARAVVREEEATIDSLRAEIAALEALEAEAVERLGKARADLDLIERMVERP